MGCTFYVTDEYGQQHGRGRFNDELNVSECGFHRALKAGAAASQTGKRVTVGLRCSGKRGVIMIAKCAKGSCSLLKRDPGHCYGGSSQEQAIAGTRKRKQRRRSR